MTRGYQNFKAYLIQDYNLVKTLPYYSDFKVINSSSTDEKGEFVDKVYVDNELFNRNREIKLYIPLENYYWVDDENLRKLIKSKEKKVILKLQELFSKYEPDYLVRKYRIMEQIGKLFRYEKKMWRLARALVGSIWGWNSTGICSKVLLKKYCVNPDCEEGEDKVYVHGLCCGSQACPICGQIYSLAQLEKYLKILTILTAMRKHSTKRILGYMVITFPAEKRMELANKEALSKIRTAVRDLLCPGSKPNKISREIAEEYGIIKYPSLLDVWHFAGLKSSPRYHPHLNVVIPVEKGYWDEKYLENMRKAISELSMEVLGFPANVWYGYKTESEEVKGVMIDTDTKTVHLARYLSVPTFLLQNEVLWDEFKGMQTYGHRGLRGYLNEDNEPKTVQLVKEMVEMMIENEEIKSERQRIEFLVRINRCPFCYERMKCERIKSIDEIYSTGDKVIEFSGMVYMIIKANKAPPPEEDDEYWEPGMGDADYITEEDKKLIEEKQRNGSRNEFV